MSLLAAFLCDVSEHVRVLSIPRSCSCILHYVSHTNCSILFHSPSSNVLFSCDPDDGKSFGELALINKNCIRNASIIADETTDLLIVNRELYNRCLHAAQAAEFEQRTSFVANQPLFQVRHSPKFLQSQFIFHSSSL